MSPPTIVSLPVPLGVAVARVAEDYRHGERTPLHTHDRAQLLFAESGLMRLETAAGTWVVPPHRAVWIPADVPHQVIMRTAVAMRSLYFRPDDLPSAPVDPQVIAISPLLRELILEACRFPRSFEPGGREDRLLHVLLDQIAFADALPVHLPQPRSPHLIAATKAIEAALSEDIGLASLARQAGVSPRHLARQFHAELRMPPGAWRQQLRMLRALELLGGGSSVTEVAFDVGYQSPSAFISAFRQHFGTSPSRYFSESGSPEQRRLPK